MTTSELIKRLGPTCAVLGLVAWCCWPYVRPTGSPLGAAPDSQLPHLARSMLNPEIREASGRDPFQSAPDPAVDGAETESAFVPIAALGRLFHKLREDRQWLVNRKTTDATDLLEQHAAPDPSALSHTLTLQATYLHPDERLAVIDHRIYAEGDRVAVAGAAGEPCTLKRVQRDQVVLHYRGQTVVLAYPQPARSPERGASPPATPTNDPTHRPTSIPQRSQAS